MIHSRILETLCEPRIAGEYTKSRRDVWARNTNKKMKTAREHV